MKVMIALDYDPTAKKVAEGGYFLAKSMGAEVLLLHVILEPIYYSNMEYSPIMGYGGNMETFAAPIDTVDGLKNASQTFLNKMKTHLGDESIQTQIKEGDFAQAILKAAKEAHVDIIVMGSHSKKWLENIVMGSVTASVVNDSTIPLYIIPTKKHK